jgi:hypothetical protein
MINGILNSERRESYPSGLREKPLLFQMSTKKQRRSSEQILGEERVDLGYQKFTERSPNVKVINKKQIRISALGK